MSHPIVKEPTASADIDIDGMVCITAHGSTTANATQLAEYLIRVLGLHDDLVNTLSDCASRLDTYGADHEILSHKAHVLVLRARQA